jgi:phosphoribosylglycinamide formyltransferase 1
MKQLHIGFMSSHGGSNMQAVLDAIQEGRLTAKPCVLISNNSKSKAAERAALMGMPFVHISQLTHPDPIEHDQAIADALL